MMVTAHHADVIVVGGGIVGASTAFFLRRRGHSVILLERGLVGQQASGVNFGNVRSQGREMSQLPLALRARATWYRMKEFVGEDAEFLPRGHLRVCYTEQKADDFARYAVEAKAHGLDLEVMSAAGLKQRFGLFGPDVVAGSLSPLDGHANPRLAAPAFGRAAARNGVSVNEGTEVLSIERRGDDFHVETRQGGSFRAPQVLVSAGAWADRLSALFDERVPLIARGPQMGVTDPLPYRIGPAIGVASPVAEEGLYFRQVARGNVVFGGGARGYASASQMRAYVDPTNTLDQLAQLRRLAPPLAAAQLIRVWSGIESYLPDDRPVMGPSVSVPGLHYAFGFCGEGFAIGPGIGETMAEWISTGQTDMPVHEYGVGRFAHMKNELKDALPAVA